ncbi:MAG: sulfatase-like hydrolase/transferase [Planctomycetota bacterium]|nr:sulfatase-like hydrolase/transferase [Planctomycetota bacterium]
MKVYYLLHGGVLGACLAGWASLIEAFFLYSAYPYQTDPLVWTSLLPSYLFVGAAIGFGCGLITPRLFPKLTERRQRRMMLGVLILVAGGTLTMLLNARMSWLPSAVGTTSPGALLLFGQILLGGMVCFAALVFVGRKLLANQMNALFSQTAVNFSVVGFLVLAGGSFALPTSSAKGSMPESTATPPADAPNVLLIVLDTVAAAHLSAYGYERETSPRLDQLASEGALFENNFSAAPWTLPSHASIFSGLLPNNHGTGWERPRLSDGLASLANQARYDFHTMAEEFNRLGYETIGASEKAWLTAETGLVQGFASYFDFSELDLRQTFLVSRFWDRYRHKFGMPAKQQIDKGGARVVGTALGWLANDRDSDKPFFMFMNLNEAHDPYEPPEEFWSTFLPEGIDIEKTKPPTLRSDVLLHREVLQSLATITPEQMALYEALYDAEILYQDGLLGRLFDGMEQMGVKDDTLIIITSDHGEEFGEIDGRVGHQLSLSDYLLHVPLIMRYPAQIPSGRRIEALSSTIDIFPTVLDILEQHRGFAMPASVEVMALEGVSQLATMQEDGPAARDMVMARYSNPAAYLSSFLEWDPEDPYRFVLAEYLRSMDVIRTPTDKLYMYSDGDRSYIDFETDPTEQASMLNVVPDDFRKRANFLEKRFDQQITSHVVARELLTGHLAWLRTVSGKSAGRSKDPVDTAGMTQQEIEEIGYVGGNVSDATQAKERISLPPFEAVDGKR